MVCQSGHWFLPAAGAVPADVTHTAELTLNSGPSSAASLHMERLNAPVPQGRVLRRDFGGFLLPVNRPIAYKRSTFAFAKSFSVAEEEATVSFDAFNVFNWLNRNYSSWGAGGGVRRAHETARSEPTPRLPGCFQV